MVQRLQNSLKGSQAKWRKRFFQENAFADVRSALRGAAEIVHKPSTSLSWCCLSPPCDILLPSFVFRTRLPPLSRREVFLFADFYCLITRCFLWPEAKSSLALASGDWFLATNASMQQKKKKRQADYVTSRDSHFETISSDQEAAHLAPTHPPEASFEERRRGWIRGSGQHGGVSAFGTQVVCILCVYIGNKLEIAHWYFTPVSESGFLSSTADSIRFRVGNFLVLFFVPALGESAPPPLDCLFHDEDGGRVFSSVALLMPTYFGEVGNWARREFTEAPHARE